MVYIKNTTAVEQRYIAHLNYESGNYRMGVKTLGVGETVRIDIRALRENQILDAEGQTIPLDVAHGQVRWTLLQSKGTDPLALIGRAEQVDEVRALSSTYACQNCCGDFFEGTFISPSSTQLQVGQSATLHAFEQHGDCYGYSYPIEQIPASWNSSNASVASVSNGQVTSVGAGQTTITATWSSYTSVPTQCLGGGFLPGPIGGCCGSAGFPRSASATVTVFQLRIRVSGASIHFEDGDSAASIVAGETFGIIAEAVDANGNVLPVNVGVSTSLSRTIGSAEIKLPSSFNLVSGSFTSGGLLFNRVTGTTSGTSYRFSTAGGGFKEFILYTYFQVTASKVGLIGGLSGCQHTIQPNDHFASLPATGLCNLGIVVRNGAMTATTTIREVGPWFPHSTSTQGNPCAGPNDPYWNTGGVPRVLSQTCDSNNAGIDLADGTASDVGIGGLGTVVWRFQ